MPWTDKGALDACCACGGGWTELQIHDAYDDMEWAEEFDSAWDQGGESWSLGPVSVNYDSAAAKIVVTVGAAAMAVVLLN